MLEGPFILKYVEGCGKTELTKYFGNYVFHQLYTRPTTPKWTLYGGFC